MFISLREKGSSASGYYDSLASEMRRDLDWTKDRREELTTVLERRSELSIIATLLVLRELAHTLNRLGSPEATTPKKVEPIWTRRRTCLRRKSARGADGIRPRARSSVAVGSGGVDREKDRLRVADAAWVREEEPRSMWEARRCSDRGSRQVKALERDNRRLAQANEFLRKASAYFA